MRTPLRLTAFSAIVGIAAMLPGVAHAALQGRIVEFGRTEGDMTAPGPGGDAGNGLAPARPMVGSRYVDHSDVIEGRLCRSFGITVRISDGRRPVPSRVDVRVIHPRFIRPDGATSLEDDFPTTVRDEAAGAGFSFDHIWEMRPGQWRIVIAHDGVELASKDFTVVDGPDGASKTDCRGGIET